MIFAVIPQVLEIFRRFRAAFAHFYVTDAVHADFDFENI
jgi:hypothetical protein